VGEPRNVLLASPEEVEGGEGVAVGRGRVPAVAAGSAGVEAQYDVVADADGGVGAAAGGQHGPGALVAEHRRQRAAAGRSPDRQIGPAHPAAGDGNEDLTGGGFRPQCHLLHGEGRVVGAQDGRSEPHVRASSWGRWTTNGRRLPYSPHGPPATPTPLSLAPAKGWARDSSAWWLIQAVPHSSRSATAAARSVSVPHTDPPSPMPVLLAASTASSVVRYGSTGRTGPNCSSVTT